MHHPIAYRIAKAFEAAGAATLRFNFRGVGTSSGHYDEGKGELEDAREALGWLRATYPTLPSYVAGFSFGAWVGLRLAAEEGGVERALAAGLPVRLFGFGFLEALRAPLAVIQADADEYGSLGEVEAALRAVRGPTQLFVLENADHVASGRLKSFEALAAEAVSWLQRSE